MARGIDEATAGPVLKRRSFATSARKTLRRPQFWFGLFVLLPTFIWYGIFSYGPILRSFWMSTVSYQIMNPSASQFVGLDNFRQIIQNPLFFISMWNTLSWAVLSFMITLPLSLLLSACLVRVRRGRNVYQAIIFLPVVVSLVAVALLFRMLMDPEVGQFNQVLRRLGLEGIGWLSSSDTALPVSVSIGVWKGVGFFVVILTAGMLNIPNELYEAALIDGANEWQLYHQITLPLLGHTLVLVAVLLVIGSLQEFTLPQVLTNGGPGNSTYLFNRLIWEEAFQQIRFGTATAAALIQFAFILLISVLQLKLLQPKWSY